MINPFNTTVKLSGAYLNNPAKFNRIAYATAWAASSTGQVISIAGNREIPAKEKRFLIPQEVANGALNITFFSAFALGAERIGEKLTGGKNPFVRVKNFTPTRQKVLSAGISALFGIIGGIIASDVVIALIRNKIAAKIQKETIPTRDRWTNPRT